MGKLLQVKNLRVSYHTYAGEVQSVRGVSFEIDKGETIAIVGESGCGKSVTAKSIMKLIKTPPGEISKESEILYEGKNILKYTKDELRQYRGSEVSMIFQDPMTFLNPTMKIGEQISESLILHRGMNKVDAMKESIRMLKIVNIPDSEKRVFQYPHEFSGGMRQRVMIAIALACNPRILIADEPTTALDVTVQSQIMELMKELQMKFGTAIILITHDMGVVAGIANKIAVMYAGQIIELGSSDDIFYNPKHPYTLALLKSVPRLDLHNKEKLITINGTPPDLISPPIGCAFAARCKFCMEICTDTHPTLTEIDDSHKVSCWLNHEYAPKIDIQSILRGEQK